MVLFVRYFRKVEKSLDIKAIFATWALNFMVAAVVFIATWLTMRNPLMTFSATLSAWTITLSLSVYYWLVWVYRKLKYDKGTTVSVAMTIVLMYLFALFVVWQTYVGVTGLFGL